ISFVRVEASYPVLSRRLRALSAAAALVAGFSQTLLDRHRVVFHDLALVDPDLHAAGAIGRLGRRDSVVDVGTQRVQRYLSFLVPLHPRDLGAAQTTAAVDAD